MPQLILLGTGGAVSPPDRTTSMLALVDEGSTILIDCGGDVVQRCLAAGVDLEEINALLVSHEHPDHTSGFPLFMEKIWLHGRRRPLPVHGIEEGIDQVRRVFEMYNTKSWEGLPEIEWHSHPCEPFTDVYADARWEIIASPGDHTVPVTGYRTTSLTTGTSICYSCDTEPSDTIAQLAKGCDILVHEANGHGRGHSTPQDAARIAREAGAGRLILTHLSLAISPADIEEARDIFPDTVAGHDLQAIEL